MRYLSLLLLMCWRWVYALIRDALVGVSRQPPRAVGLLALLQALTSDSQAFPQPELIHLTLMTPVATSLHAASVRFVTLPHMDC